jgi:hypothetical protein
VRWVYYTKYRYPTYEDASQPGSQHVIGLMHFVQPSQRFVVVLLNDCNGISQKCTAGNKLNFLPVIIKSSLYWNSLLYISI